MLLCRIVNMLTLFSFGCIMIVIKQIGDGVVDE